MNDICGILIKSDNIIMLSKEHLEYENFKSGITGPEIKFLRLTVKASVIPYFLCVNAYAQQCEHCPLK